MSLEMYSMTGLPDWQVDIICSYPELYLEPDPEVIASLERQGRKWDATCCNLRFGFECKGGWAELLEDFSDTASKLIRELRSSGLQPDARINAVIMKEKFGTLHWQGGDNLREPFHRLLFAHKCLLRQRSENVCEITGKWGTMRKIDGWWTVMSDDEYAKATQANKSTKPQAVEWRCSTSGMQAARKLVNQIDRQNPEYLHHCVERLVVLAKAHLPSFTLAEATLLVRNLSGDTLPAAEQIATNKLPYLIQQNLKTWHADSGYEPLHQEYLTCGHDQAWLNQFRQLPEYRFAERMGNELDPLQAYLVLVMVEMYWQSEEHRGAVLSDFLPIRSKLE